MKETDQIIAAEIFEWFSRYLIEAEIYLIADEDYDDVQDCFIACNLKPMIEHPGRIVPSHEAYKTLNESESKDDIFSKDPKPQNEESGCGLTEGFLVALFLLQHVRYTDTVTKQTDHVYKADRRYYPEENREMLKIIEEQKDNPYSTALISWAKRKQPIHVKDKVHHILKFTPGSPGSLNLNIASSSSNNSNESYQEDRSKYKELDVFGDTPEPEPKPNIAPVNDNSFKSIIGNIKSKVSRNI